MPTIANLDELANTPAVDFQKTFTDNLDTICKYSLKDIKTTLEKQDEITLLELYKQLGERVKTTFENNYGDKILINKSKKRTAIPAICSLAVSIVNDAASQETDQLFRVPTNAALGNQDVTVTDPDIDAGGDENPQLRDEIKAILEVVTKLTTTVETLEQRINGEMAALRLLISAQPLVQTDATTSNNAEGDDNDGDVDDENIPPSGTTAELPTPTTPAGDGSLNVQLTALLERITTLETTITNRSSSPVSATIPVPPEETTKQHCTLHKTLPETPTNTAPKTEEPEILIHAAPESETKEVGTLYVGNVSVEVSTIDVIQTFTNLGADCIETEPLKNGPNSRSFKITIPEKQMESMITNKKWPKGVTVRRFKEFTRTPKQTEKGLSAAPGKETSSIKPAASYRPSSFRTPQTTAHRRNYGGRPFRDMRNEPMYKSQQKPASGYYSDRWAPDHFYDDEQYHSRPYRYPRYEDEFCTDQMYRY